MCIYIGLEGASEQVENARIIHQRRLSFPKFVNSIDRINTRKNTSDKIFKSHNISKGYISAASSGHCEISSKDGFWKQLNALYQFFRPHTIFGTVSYLICLFIFSLFLRKKWYSNSIYVLDCLHLYWC